MDPRKGDHLSSFWIGDFKDVCFAGGGGGNGTLACFPLWREGQPENEVRKQKKTQEREARRPGCIVPALPNE